MKKTKHMQKFKIWLLILVVSGFVLLFQNCKERIDSLNKAASPSDPALAFSGGAGYGNGGGYEGKLTYYKVLPGHTCEGRPAPLAVIDLNGISATLTYNSTTKCGQKMTIEMGQLDVPSYSNIMIGLGSSIFERHDSQPNVSKSATSIETWCRWDKSQRSLSDGEGLDTYIIADHLNDTRQAIIIKEYLDPNTDKMGFNLSSPIQVKEQLASFRINYFKRADQNADHEFEFLLTVMNFFEINAADGHHFGELEVHNSQYDINKNVHCRMSQSLDDKIAQSRELHNRFEAYNQSGGIRIHDNGGSN